jgi:dihydroflavonol-4-reductase
MSHDKAVRELGWEPRPATEALAEAAGFFRSRRRTKNQESS